MSTIIFDKKVVEAINLAFKYPCIKRVGIFGSYARGNNDSTSDIDLLYDYDGEFEQRTDELLGYVEEIDEIIKEVAHVPKIDYVWYEGVLRSTNENFKQAVLSEVVWIYDRQGKNEMV